MNYSVYEILSLTKAKRLNIEASELEKVVDWIFLVETASIKKPLDAKNVVYFAVHETDPERHGWYSSPIDNRKKIPGLFAENPHWIFVVENSYEDLDRLLSLGCKLLVVENATVAALEIHKETLRRVSPRIIGVTGSVGKTTCVALLEEVLCTKGKTLRIYSKRLSPFSVMTAIINKLSVEHQFVVMEYSLYRFWHVEALAELLKPSLGVLLNIGGSHLGVGGIRSGFDIFMAKNRLLAMAERGIACDDLQEQYPFGPGTVFFGFDKSSRVYFDKEASEFSLCGKRITIRIPILTELTLKQIAASLCVLSLLGQEADGQVVSAIERFSPKENRLSLHQYQGSSVFFDGEASYASRLSELSKNYYPDSVLILIQMNHGEEPLEPQKRIFAEVRKRFRKIYFLDSLDTMWVRKFGGILRPDEIFPAERFPEVLRRHKTAFVHAGNFWRTGLENDVPLIKEFFV